MKLTQEANKEIRADINWALTTETTVPEIVATAINFILCDFHDEAREAGHDLELTILRAARTILEDMTVEEAKSVEAETVTS